MSSPLHSSSRIGDLKEIERLLNNGADIDSKDSFHNTPLFYAVIDNRLEAASLLINHGANVNARNIIKYTPLHIVSEQGNFECMELLVNSGAEIDNIDEKWGVTPIFCASFWGHSMIVRYLCRKKAKVAGVSALFGYTALHLATVHSNVTIVKDLLDHGAEIDAQADNGATPLLMAFGNKSPNVAKLLVNYGAGIDIQDNRGEWPLYCATLSGSLEMVDFLLQSGADMNRRTKSGDTVIHAACQIKKTKILKLFVKINRMNVNALTNDRNTPLHVAVASGNVKTVEILLTYGAKPSVDMKNLKNETPVDIASRRGKQDVLTVLGRKRRSSSVFDTAQYFLNNNDTINKAMEILRNQFPFVSGLQTLCKEGHHFSPKHSKFMQIINEGDRYTVASTIGMQNGHVEYYNPMRTNNSLSEETKLILTDITSNFNETSKLFIHCPRVVHTFSQNDSGLLCLAIAIAILHTGYCPNKSLLEDIDLIRENISVGIKSKKFRPWFPSHKLNERCKLACARNGLLTLLPIHKPSANLDEDKFVIDLHCLCHQPLDDKMRQCSDCGRYVHPNCVLRFEPERPASTDEETEDIYCPDCIGGDLLPRSLLSLTNESDKMFDAFVSYSYGDLTFVKKQLIPHLEEDRDPQYNFRLMIEHRNMMPGADIPDAILDGIAASRKFIAVVSKNYVLGQWNMFEWNHMVWHKYHNMILILVDSYESLSYCSMPPSLRNYLDNKMCLEWSENFSTEKRIYFWEKLKRFLHPPLKYRNQLHIRGLAIN